MGEKEKSPKASLNVSTADHKRILKIAALRDLTVEELFAAKDLREFFAHALAAELLKEQENLGRSPTKEGPPPPHPKRS